MKTHKWQIKFGALLIAASILIYCTHYLIFKDAHHLFIFMIGELAFLPLEVLLVGLVLDKFIEKREKEHMLEKLNVVIGVFFNELGTNLLNRCVELDSNSKSISDQLLIDNSWDDKQFKEALSFVKKYSYTIDMERVQLGCLQKYLYSKKEFMLKLLENPNILEHETFTYLLTSIFHLEEELCTRNLEELNEEELEHLQGDITRIYSSILSQWILYMKYQKKAFPFLFNSAIKHNPFLK